MAFYGYIYIVEICGRIYIKTFFEIEFINVALRSVVLSVIFTTFITIITFTTFTIFITSIIFISAPVAGARVFYSII